MFPNGRPVRESINKQLAHFSLERVSHTQFWFPTVVDEVLADMKTFAEDKSNVCYPELAGARALLTRQPWLTTF